MSGETPAPNPPPALKVQANYRFRGPRFPLQPAGFRWALVQIKGNENSDLTRQAGMPLSLDEVAAVSACDHSYSFSLSLFLSLSLSLSPTHTLSLSLSQTHTKSLTHSHSLSLFLGGDAAIAG